MMKTAGAIDDMAVDVVSASESAPAPAAVSATASSAPHDDGSVAGAVDGAPSASSSGSRRARSARVAAQQDRRGEHWIGARAGFMDMANNEHRNTDACLFFHQSRDGRAAFDPCAQKHVVFSAEFKRDMSQRSVADAIHQLLQDFAVIVRRCLGEQMPVLFG
mgnify:FL=1